MPRIRPHAAIVACFLSAASVASAQDLSILEGRIDNVVTCDLANDCNDRLADLLDNVYRVLLVEDTAQDLAFRRADVQVGASSGSSGSTSAVLDPVIPAAFSVALETGSIIKSTTGDTATLQINPAGLICATGPEAAAVQLRDRRCSPETRRVGVSLSFDTSRGDGVEGVTSLGNQFSEVGVRVEILNRRQPASRWFRDKVDQWASTAQEFAAISARISTEIEPIIEQASANIWTLVTDAKENDVTPRVLKTRLRSAVAQVITDIRTAASAGKINLPEHIIQVASQVRTAQARRNEALFNQLAHAWVVTAEYAFQRPNVAVENISDVISAGMRPPSLHTARLIAAKGIPRRNVDITLNLSSSWFETESVVEKGHWRDVQIGLNSTLLLRQIPEFGNPVLSFAGVWMYLHQKPLGSLSVEVFNNAKVNRAGPLWLFQTKLEIPTANAAVRVPISFTYASRTEMVKESDVRGQLGISLNMDALFAGSN